MSGKIEFKADGKSQIKLNNVKGKKKAKQLQISAFKVLINPNVRVEEDEEDFQEIHDIVLETTQSIFDNLKNFKEYVKFNNKDSWSRETIKSVENYYSVEYGPENKTIHVHISSEIQHFSNILLDRKKLIQEYADALDIDKSSVLINIEIMDSEEKKRALNYIRKVSDVPAEAKE